MYEIKFEKLELHKKYYIQTPHGKLKHYGFFKGFTNDTPENMHGIFVNVKRIKRNSLYIKYFICYRDNIHWKYFVPEKENILQRFEKNNLHLILRSITNDPSFFYYS
jgi:hypothetical protein